MRIIWDAPIEMDDGVILHADVFLPEAEGKYPVIMTWRRLPLAFRFSRSNIIASSEYAPPTRSSNAASAEPKWLRSLLVRAFAMEDSPRKES